MKLELTVSETLIWHDGPQLFVTSDSIGGTYLCLATGDGLDAEPTFLTVAISAPRLQALKLNKIDLHEVFKMPELNNWLLVELTNTDQLVAEPFNASKGVPEHMLPTPGVFLPSRPLHPEIFEALKMSAVAKEANMNPTLLRQYVSGTKQPSTEQIRRVQAALHRMANRLLEVRLV